MDVMQTIMGMAKSLMAVKNIRCTFLSNIQFMAPLSHDVLASGMYQKPGIPKQVTFQDIALFRRSMIVKKYWKRLTCLKENKMKDPEDNWNHQVYKILEIEPGLETILQTALEILKIKTKEKKGYPMVRTDLKINPEKIKLID